MAAPAAGRAVAAVAAAALAAVLARHAVQSPDRAATAAAGDGATDAAPASACVSVRATVDLCSVLPAAPSAPQKTPELRIVEGGRGVAPSAQMYHGWPTEIKDASKSDVGSLLAAARAAAANGGGANNECAG